MRSVLFSLILTACYAEVKQFNFEVSRFNAAPDGFKRQVIGVNGKWPPPVLHVMKGDQVHITVKNSLDIGTSLHMHGFFQQGTPWYPNANY